MESLLSNTYSGSNLSSREQSLDQPECLQVPVLHLPDCNGTTFPLHDHCCEEAPLTSQHHIDQEEDEVEEVLLLAFVLFLCTDRNNVNVRLLKWFLVEITVNLMRSRFSYF